MPRGVANLSFGMGEILPRLGTYPHKQGWISVQRLGEGRDYVVDRLGAEAEAEQVGGEAVGGEFGAAGFARDEVVVRQVDER